MSIPDEAKSEMKSTKSETSTVVTSVCTVAKKFECLIPCERYSSLNKLIMQRNFPRKPGRARKKLYLQK